MKRKGLAVTGLLVAASSILGVSMVLGAVYGGSLGEFIKGGADNVEDATSETVEVRSEAELSALARMAYLRAKKQGCKGTDSSGQCAADIPSLCHQNQNENPNDPWQDLIKSETGFPELEDTFIGRKPACAGAAPIPGVRSPDDAVTRTGQDMEGIFSKVKFRIPEDATRFEIQDGGGTWLEDHHLAGTQGSFFQNIDQNCDGKKYGTSGPFFSFYFDADSLDSGDQRSYPRIQDGIDSNLNPQTKEFNSPYCGHAGGDLANFRAPVYQAFRPQGSPADVYLCPGDEGYIQINKGKEPMNTGEADGTIQGFGSNKQMNARQFAYIEITKAGEGECVNIDTEPKYSVKSNEIKDYPGAAGKALVVEFDIQNDKTSPKKFDISLDNSNLDTYFSTDGSVEIQDGLSRDVLTQIPESRLSAQGYPDLDYCLVMEGNELKCDITLTWDTSLPGDNKYRIQ